MSLHLFWQLRLNRKNKEKDFIMKKYLFVTLLLIVFANCSFAQITDDFRKKLDEIHENVHLIILIESPESQRKLSFDENFNTKLLPELNKKYYDTIKSKIASSTDFTSGLDTLKHEITKFFSQPDNQNRIYTLKFVSRYINSFKDYFSSANSAADPSSSEAAKGSSGNPPNTQKTDSSNEYLLYLLGFTVLCIFVLFYLIVKIKSQNTTLASQIVNILKNSDSKGGGGNLRVNEIGDLKRDLTTFRTTDLPRMINGINDQIFRLDKKFEQLTNPVPGDIPHLPQKPSQPQTQNKIILYVDQLETAQGWSKSKLSTVPGLYKMEFPNGGKNGKITINQDSVTTAIFYNPFQSFPAELCDYKSSNINNSTKLKVIKEGEVIDEGSFIKIKEKIVVEFIK